MHLKQELEQFDLADGKKTVIKYDFNIEPAKVAYTNTGGIVYNITSFDFTRADIPYHGCFQVLKTIINLEYLWNKIRVQGGAYGCGCKFTNSGFSYLYSYRDANLKETYDVYKELIHDIETFDADEREMTKYILGTINEMDQPKTNMDKLNAAINKFYKGITDESVIDQRRQILKTSAADIRDCKKLLQLITCDNICTIGSEQIIEQNQGFFSDIKTLL